MNGVAPEVAAATSDTQKQAPVAMREAQQIVVERGQSLSRIAAKYGMRQRPIIDANNLTPPYKITIGQRLLIPGSDGPPPAPVVAGAARPEIIPLDPPAPAGSMAPPPTATTTTAAATTTAPQPAALAVKPIEVAAPAGNQSPEPVPAPVAPAVATSTAPPASAEPPAPAEQPAPATTAAVPAPAAVSAAAPPGVTCPPGTTGVWSEDIIKKPLYICRRPPSQS